METDFPDGWRARPQADGREINGEKGANASSMECGAMTEAAAYEGCLCFPYPREPSCRFCNDLDGSKA